MRTVANFLRTLSIIVLTGTSILNLTVAQDTLKSKESSKAAGIERKVKEKDFVFVASSASPMGGAIRQLTSRYDLKVTADTIISNLPYFGRAYSAPINPSDGGISFTSTTFQYSVKDRRRGGWEITIKPAD